jgi:medium-chain acyl-[acyl-carrier-protein] hydrolase
MCFPHAGASALAYGRWRQELAGRIAVRAIELPGRLGRQLEPLPTTMPDLLAAVAPQVDSAAIENCVLYGHSMGALLAFEMAHRLTERDSPPALLVVSGRNGPTRASNYPHLHRLPDAELLTAVDGLDTSMAALRDQPGLAELFLPVLRADLTVAETYVYRARATPLPCPILSLQGRHDPVVSRVGVQAWAAETTAGCTTTWLPGEHFFHLTRPDFLAELPAAIAAACA